MKLNENFDKSLESIINTCKPLADWFERNQEMMAYLYLTKEGCNQYNNNCFVSEDIKTLGRMSNICLTWLNNSEFSIEDRTYMAVTSIAQIYIMFKEKLSDYAKESFKIDHELVNTQNTTITRIKK